MKFFVPGTKDDAHAERFYGSIKKYNADTVTISSRRIFALNYFHNDNALHNEVGMPDPLIDDIVLAILETDTMYYICTINGGVVRGEPIIVDPDEVENIIYFEP